MAKVDRRNALKLLGFGLVTAGTGSIAKGASASVGRRAQDLLGLEVTPKDAQAVTQVPGATMAQRTEDAPWHLVAPYELGSRAATSRIVGMSSTETGAVSVDFETDGGKRFRVDVCRRDAGVGAPRPVAHTEHHDFFLANGGRGDKPTERSQHLAVLALAWAVGRNEIRGSGPTLLTMRERWQRFHPSSICKLG